MKKEFGKWLMDIAKYMTTAVLLSSVFNDIRELWIVYVACGLSVLILLCLGLSLVKDSGN